MYLNQSADETHRALSIGYVDFTRTSIYRRFQNRSMGRFTLVGDELSADIGSSRGRRPYRSPVRDGIARIRAIVVRLKSWNRADK